MQPIFRRASPWLLGMLLSTPAWAVSVGDMRALSALGEPLRMELELVDLQGARVSEIQLAPAQAADYARLGLIAPVGSDTVSFAVSSSAGHVLAQLTSPQVQTDPHVSLLVQISWPGAVRLQQVAAVLLPAAARAAVEAPVAPTLAASEASASEGVTIPVGPTGNAAPDAGKSTTAVVSATGGDGTVLTQGRRLVVRAGDSLSTLAAAWDAPRLHIAQRAQLIAESNPRIFIGGNINLLRTGATLTLPGADTEPVPSQDEAAAWLKAHAAGHPLAQPAAVAASSTSAAAADNAEITLTLVSPAANGQGVGTPAAPVAGDDAELSEEMAAAESTREALEDERAALQARLQALKTQTDAQDARLKLLDERLAALNSPRQPAPEPKQDKSVDATSWLAIGFALLVLVFWILRRSALQAEEEREAALAAERAREAGSDLVEFRPSDEFSAAPMPGLQPGGAGDEEEYDFLTDSETESFQTRLDLAQAYLDMGETKAAHELLRVVRQGGTASQRQRAGDLLGSTG